jgi:hypothetical protein
MDGVLMYLVQVDSDSRMVWDFFVCARSEDAGISVDQETFNRWRETHAAWLAMQNELRALHDANPGTEIGDRLPRCRVCDDERVIQGKSVCAGCSYVDLENR